MRVTLLTCRMPRSRLRNALLAAAMYSILFCAVSYYKTVSTNNHDEKAKLLNRLESEANEWAEKEHSLQDKIRGLQQKLKHRDEKAKLLNRLESEANEWAEKEHSLQGKIKALKKEVSMIGIKRNKTLALGMHGMDDNLQMPSAICFYGLTRNLRLTLQNIERHIFQVLERGEIDVDVFMHAVFAGGGLTNHHSNEISVSLDPYDPIMLRPCVYEVEIQSLVRTREWKKFKNARMEMGGKVEDPYDDNFTSVKNYLVAMASLKRVGDLVSHYAHTYKVPIYA